MGYVHKQGLSEAYREVIHEYKIKVDGATRAPDYCFTVYGQRKFFVDAKKPSIDVKSNVAPAYQVRRYGWSAKLPIAIVTDFEEFSIYDCSRKPKQNDRSSVERIRYLTYDKYLDEFDFIYGTFAKESVLKGSFDKYVQSDTKKKGTATVDNEFLKSIEEWRTYLASTIALRNKKLSEDEINYAVQKTIDRIIFLRICEDRGIEQYGELKNSLKDGTFYDKLFKLYRSTDEKYNSGLFDFKEDTITLKLKVDNKAVKKIIKELYYPVSPYEFSVLPADILGSVYERFLGKTIRLTKAHYAKIEEKPEVRKAGGVYYTPKYIVDYIVENTVGKLLKGKKPKDVEKLKIVDPACGSGSFLIGAYQYLLDWHLKYYIKNPTRKTKDNPLSPDGNLTTAEKKRILLNNIYGVDIDAQAVEVTKLNLLLKALEGETKASIDKQLTFFNERVLPNLGDNIKCGNSLIGTDFYDEQPGLFTDNIKKINAFDWDKAFTEIFKNGGFDAVIGNPPYVRQEEIKNMKEYFIRRYSKVYEGTADLYIYFIFIGMYVLREKGFFGFIVSNKFTRSGYGKKLRDYIKNNYTILQYIDKFKEKVFKDASVDPCIIILNKIKAKASHQIKFNSKESVLQKSLLIDSWTFASNELIDIKNKIEKNGKRIKEWDGVEIYFGIKSGLSKAFIINEEKKNELSDKFNKDIYKPLLRGRDVKKYYINWDNLYLIDARIGRDINNYSSIYHFLETFKKKLLKRTDYKKDLMHWYNLRSCTYYDEFEKPKIIYPDISETGGFYWDNKNYYFNNTVYMITHAPKYWVALLNSKLLSWYYRNIASGLGKKGIRYFKQFVELIPIVEANTNTKTKLEKTVDQLQILNKDLHAATLAAQREQIQRAIDHAERKIDEIVYELYGLSEEEVRIIEKETSKN